MNTGSNTIDDIKGKLGAELAQAVKYQLATLDKPDWNIGFELMDVDQRSSLPHGNSTFNQMHWQSLVALVTAGALKASWLEVDMGGKTILVKFFDRGTGKPLLGFFQQKPVVIDKSENTNRLEMARRATAALLCKALPRAEET